MRWEASMKIDKTKPHEVLKDPDKAAAERQAKRKALGEAFVFFLCMGLAIWWLKSPDTLKATIIFLLGLLK